MIPEETIHPDLVGIGGAEVSHLPFPVAVAAVALRHASIKTTGDVYVQTIETATKRRTVKVETQLDQA